MPSLPQGRVKSKGITDIGEAGYLAAVIDPICFPKWQNAQNAITKKERRPIIWPIRAVSFENIAYYLADVIYIGDIHLDKTAVPYLYWQGDDSACFTP